MERKVIQMIYRVLIVDDEYPAREEIRYCLKKHEKISVVGEAADYEEALKLVKSIDYDLVFLDINFPEKNGIDIGRDISDMDNPPFIIYVTAHANYALKAFEVNAIDYLLKPIDDEKLNRSLNKFYKLVGSSKANTEDFNVNRISAEQDGKISLVSPEDIFYAYSEQGYVFIQQYDNKLISRYTLTELEEKLAMRNFFRVNKSFLVNLNKINQISPIINGSHEIILSDKSKSHIMVSRRQWKKLKIIFDL